MYAGKVKELMNSIQVDENLEATANVYSTTEDSLSFLGTSH